MSRHTCYTLISAVLQEVYVIAVFEVLCGRKGTYLSWITNKLKMLKFFATIIGVSVFDKWVKLRFWK